MTGPRPPSQEQGSHCGHHKGKGDAPATPRAREMNPLVVADSRTRNPDPGNNDKSNENELRLSSDRITATRSNRRGSPRRMRTQPRQERPRPPPPPPSPPPRDEDVLHHANHLRCPSPHSVRLHVPAEVPSLVDDVLVSAVRVHLFGRVSPVGVPRGVLVGEDVVRHHAERPAVAAVHRVTASE